MTNSFDTREKDFESQFALEEEYEFKAKVIAAKLFGLWAANEMHLSKDESTNYSQDIINMSINSNDYENIINKIYHDFASKNISDNRSKLEHILTQKIEEAFNRLQSSIK